MKKKKLNILALIIMMLCIVACGKENKTINSTLNNNLKTSDLSIDDFVIETEKIKKYGNDYYVTTLTNNSDYPIIAFQLDYEPKDDVSDSDLKIYDDFMKEHYDWIESDDVTGVILRASGEKLVKKGYSIEQATLNIGYGNWSWYNVPNKSQYELMEPKELQIAIIGKDNVLYVAYYSFDDEEWIFDEVTKKMNTWPETNLAKEISKPDCNYMLLTSDIEDEENLNFTAYEITNDNFKKYVQMVKDAGFTIDAPEEFFGYYSAENDNGHSISISYDEDEETMSVNINNW